MRTFGIVLFVPGQARDAKKNHTPENLGGRRGRTEDKKASNELCLHRIDPEVISPNVLRREGIYHELFHLFATSWPLESLLQTTALQPLPRGHLVGESNADTWPLSYFFLLSFYPQ